MRTIFIRNILICWPTQACHSRQRQRQLSLLPEPKFVGFEAVTGRHFIGKRFTAADVTAAAAVVNKDFDLPSTNGILRDLAPLILVLEMAFLDLSVQQQVKIALLKMAASFMAKTTGRPG